LAQILPPGSGQSAAAAANLQQHMLIRATGDNLLTISYTSTRGGVGIEVLSALLQAVRATAAALHVQQIQLTDRYAANDLRVAQEQEQRSARALTAALQAHRFAMATLRAQLSSDITLNMLYAQYRADQQAVTNAWHSLTQAAGANLHSLTRSGFVHRGGCSSDCYGYLCAQQATCPADGNRATSRACCTGCHMRTRSTVRSGPPVNVSGVVWLAH
jgi:hypothetical protein